MKKPFSFKKFVMYAVSFFGYLFLTLLDEEFSPFSLALLIAHLYAGLNPLPSFLLYGAPFLLAFDWVKLGCALFAGTLISIAFALYAKKDKAPKFELVAVACFALVPYCAFHPKALPIKLIVCAAIILSSFIMTKGAKVLLIKGLKYRLGADDFSSAAFTCIFCGYGGIIAFGEGFYLAITLLLVLFSALLLGGCSPLLLGCVAAIPLALFRLDLAPIGVLAIYSLGVLLTSNYSRLLTAVYCAVLTALLYFFTDLFVQGDIVTPVLLGAVFIIYLFFSDRLIQKWKRALKIHRSDNLSRYLINTHRSDIAGKLFEISAVFDEMSYAVANLKSPPQDKQTAAQLIACEITQTVCSNCKRHQFCEKHFSTLDEELNKIVFFGLSKGSVNFVDLPKDFSCECHRTEKIVNLTTRRISEYLASTEEKIALNRSRDLMANQTDGVASALKRLAVGFSKQLESDYESETLIKQALAKRGICVKELTVFVGGEQEEIGVVLEREQVKNPQLLKSIDEIMGYKSIIVNNRRISEDLCAIKISRRPDHDAVFGLKAKIKNGSKKSGDTHSIFKISESKFLAILSDGMGSGAKAEETSSNAISLVETLYKAGLDSKTVLPIVNKLLTLISDDNFTAMDLCLVDLNAPSADFVKIGSPYSFILTKDTVKIIEGGSLPLGILDEISPTTCHTDLTANDLLILISDGVADAFGSSSDLVEFLSMQKALNPQTLADRLIDRALELDGGYAKDDMTAFCIRIFKR